MGKIKSSQSSMKISKKPSNPLNSLIKTLRPKVYIIDSSNFKNLVQELTGNGNGYRNSPVSSPPPPPAFVSPSKEVLPAIIEIEDHIHAYQENNLEDQYFSSFDSSTCFSTPSESPDLQYPGPQEPMISYMDFSSHYSDVEALLLGTDDQVSYSSDDHACYYPLVEQEVCAFDYDLSGLI